MLKAVTQHKYKTIPLFHDMKIHFDFHETKDYFVTVAKTRETEILNYLSQLERPIEKRVGDETDNYRLKHLFFTNPAPPRRVRYRLQQTSNLDSPPPTPAIS